MSPLGRSPRRCPMTGGASIVLERMLTSRAGRCAVTTESAGDAADPTRRCSWPVCTQAPASSKRWRQASGSTRTNASCKSRSRLSKSARARPPRPPRPHRNCRLSRRPLNLYLVVAVPERRRRNSRAGQEARKARRESARQRGRAEEGHLRRPRGEHICARAEHRCCRQISFAPHCRPNTELGITWHG